MREIKNLNFEWQFKANVSKDYQNELNIEYVVVNPTAGSHCGPDTVGISFHAIHR